MDNKHAIILNYSMMSGEIYDTMKEKADFMRRFWDEEVRLDPDIQDIGAEFQNLCIALKRFDKMVNAKGKEFNELQSRRPNSTQG